MRLSALRIDDGTNTLGWALKRMPAPIRQRLRHVHVVKKDSLTVTGRTKQFTRIADSGNEVAGVLCPDCGVRIEPWEEDGELWRRQKVILPDNIANHTRAGQQFRPGRAFAPA
jgi:hypothetical protein